MEGRDGGAARPAHKGGERRDRGGDYLLHGAMVTGHREPGWSPSGDSVDLLGSTNCNVLVRRRWTVVPLVGPVADVYRKATPSGISRKVQRDCDDEPEGWAARHRVVGPPRWLCGRGNTRAIADPCARVDRPFHLSPRFFRPGALLRLAEPIVIAYAVHGAARSSAGAMGPHRAADCSRPLGGPRGSRARRPRRRLCRTRELADDGSARRGARGLLLP